MLNIGFIGLGGMGRARVGAFAQVEGCRLYAGADPSEGARDELSRMRPEMKTFADHRAMLDDDGVDAVLVATPTTPARPSTPWRQGGRSSSRNPWRRRPRTVGR